MMQDMADDSGVIDSDVSDRLTTDINIRQDDLSMFELTDGTYAIQTPDMESGVYIQPTPSPNGFTTTVVVEPEISQEVAPAEPAEQPEVESGKTVRIRMD
jgi:hypothetical protein